MSVHRVPLADEAGTIRCPSKPLQGRYHVRYLARGGMGCAYRAVLGQRVCFIKEVSKADQTAVDHLRGEAQMLQRLPLGNFPRFVELFEEDGYLYLVTEFLEGLTLEQEVQRNPWTYPEDAELRALALDLCRQLEILHALKPPILYLDLKPGNTIRTADGKLHLVDFGISRLYIQPFTAGTYEGSPQTASPEHFTGKLDRRSDLFSLAATVHYVATRGQAERPLHAAFPSAREYHPELSEELDAWLQKCLRLRADDRFPDVTAARLALEGGAPPDASPKSVPAWKRWLGLG